MYNIKMKNRYVVWGKVGLSLSFFFLIAGCGSSSKQTKQEGIKQEQQTPSRTLLSEISGSTLAYLKYNKFIHLGESAQTILSLFPKPEGAVAISTLPPSLSPPLVANGWDAENESLGIISEDDKVILMMHTYNQVNDHKIEETYTRYLKHFKRPTQELSGLHSKYWFWDSGSTRLMIASSIDSKGVHNLTIAFGVHSVMDRLRMDPKDAKEDQTKAAQLLEKNKNLKK